jgi:hypothetical protein
MTQDINLNLDSKYNLFVTKDRDLDRDIICEVYSGDTVIGYFDWTPYSGATMQVKIKATDTYSILEFSVNDGSIELNSNGVLRLVKSASEMNVKAGSYVYDMYLIKSGNSQSKRQFLSGNFIITQDVTE